jgi:cell wall-associated NlpC family hydrolase
MARIGGGAVPVYQRQIQEQPMPAARMADVVDPAAFGVGGAQAMLRGADQMDRAGRETFGLGMMIQKRARELQQEEDHAAALDASNQFLTEVNGYLYNDQTGLMNKKGKDAIGIAATAPDELSKISKTIGSKLKNPNQQLLFGRMVGSEINSTIREVFRHQAKEKYFYDEQNTAALVDNFKRAMVMTDSVDKYLDSRAALEANIRNRYEKTHGTTFVNETIFNVNSDVHLQKANNLALSSYEAGMSYLTAHKNEIDPAKFSASAKVFTEKLKKIDYNVQAKSILAETGYNLPAALARIQGGGTAAPSWTLLKAAGDQYLGMQYKLGGDGKTSIDCSEFTRQVFAKVGVDLGTRDASEQARKLNDSGTFFADRSQLQPGDMVFYKNTYEPPEGHGFQNITHVGIYAGDGKILHAGSSKGVSYTMIDSPGEVAGYGRVAKQRSKEEDYELNAAVVSEFGKFKYVKDATQHDEMIRVKNILATTSDPAVWKETIENSSLEPYMKSATIKAMVENRESTDRAKLSLITMRAQGKLTTDAVNQFASELSKNDLMRFWEDAVKISVGKDDKISESANHSILQMVEEVGSYSKEEKAALKLSVMQRLDDEGLTGWTRQSRAKELIEEDKKEKGSVYKTHFQNTERVGWLKRSWDEREVDLVLEGMRLQDASLGVKREPDTVYAEQVLMSINRKDPTQQKAVDHLIALRQPITIRNLNTVAGAIESLRSNNEPLTTANINEAIRRGIGQGYQGISLYGAPGAPSVPVNKPNENFQFNNDYMMTP